MRKLLPPSEIESNDAADHNDDLCGNLRRELLRLGIK